MTKRFINADSYVSTGQGLQGYNTYAYCNNNPVTLVDPNGNFPWLIVGFLAIFAIGGGVFGANADINIGEVSSAQEHLPSIDKSITDVESDDELNTGDRIKNTIIGASLGLAVGGAVVALVGVATTLSVGSTAVVGFLGLNGPQTAAVGILVYNLVACLAPLVGMEKELVEYKTSQ